MSHSPSGLSGDSKKSPGERKSMGAGAWSLIGCVPIWAGVILGITTGRWWTFGGMRPEFVGYEDLAWIARWATCISGKDPLQAVSECGIAYPLPGVWLANVFGFRQDHLLFVGTFLALLWAIAVTGLAVGLARRAGLGWSLLMLAALAAPPSWLLLERGNLDIVVWILVLLSLWAMISGRCGLPKLRQLVIARGLAPTAHRLRNVSATACLPPS